MRIPVVIVGDLRCLFIVLGSHAKIFKPGNHNFDEDARQFWARNKMFENL